MYAVKTVMQENALQTPTFALATVTLPTPESSSFVVKKLQLLRKKK